MNKRFSFSDLLGLPHEFCRVDPAAIKHYLPNTPQEVIIDLYSEHGRNRDFQELYAVLDLTKLRWEKTTTTAADIIACGYNPMFKSWFESVRGKAKRVQSIGWKCADDRAEVSLHWEKQGTWIKPPFFLNEDIISAGKGFWLIEGHTRTALLTGLVQQSVINIDSKHDIWLAYV